MVIGLAPIWLVVELDEVAMAWVDKPSVLAYENDPTSVDWVDAECPEDWACQCSRPV